MDVERIRAGFPALAREVGGRPAVFADGPGGTQVPRAVIDAMAGHLERGTANLGGRFVTSEETGEVVAAARQAMADLLGGRSSEVVFGPNMTTLTFAFSRALSRRWGPGDNVVVTRLDHDANVSPWMLAAADRGAEVRFVPFRGDTTLDMEALDRSVDERTRVVAVTAASNALGTIVDVAAVAAVARERGAWSYVDAVHLAPHRKIDVSTIGCDALVCSPYKFFGPHAGALWARSELLAAVEPYRVRPAPSEPPGSFENGTPAFEALAGIAATVDHLAEPGQGSDRRARLDDAFARAVAHERALAEAFLEGIRDLNGVRLHGLATADPERRTPTFAIEVAGRDPHDVAAALGAEGIFVWAGDYYAVEVMRALGLPQGAVRVGFVRYNTLDEVDRVVSSLAVLVP